MSEPLTEVERRVAGALIMSPGASVTDRTVEAIVRRSGLSEREVVATLRQLESLDPPLAHRDRDATLGVEFWIAIEPGASEHLDPPEP